MRKMEIGKRISKLRKEKGVTQKELADYLCVTDKAISRWESGVGNPDIDFIPKICEFFNVSIDYLLLGKEPEQAITEQPQEDTQTTKTVEDKEDVKIEKPKLSKKIKIVISCSIIGVLLLIGGTIGIVFGVKESNNLKIYRNAINLMEAGQYDDSISTFNKIKDYKDSSQKIEVCYGLISIDNSKTNNDYQLLKDGVKKIYTAGEMINVTYDGKGRVIKEEMYQFDDTISTTNPGISEPINSDFIKWEVVSSFYLNYKTRLFLTAKWAV